MMLAAALLAAVAAGCGGVTPAGFAARAGAICTSALRAERSLAPPRFAGSSVARARSLNAYLRGELAIVSSEDRRLRALPRPAESAAARARLDAYLGAMRTLVEIVHNLTASRASPQIVGLSNAALADLPVSRLAADAGLPGCAAPRPTIR